MFAPVRTEGLFCRLHGLILHREQPCSRQSQRGIPKTSVRDSPVRIFVVARQQRAVPLSDKLAFVRQRYNSLCKAGSEYNRSHFIIKRIFAEEFVVVRRDPSKVQFVAQLNDFYFQFQKLANNYNQIVKVINTHFSNVAIPHQIAALGQRTREPKALSIEIPNLAKQAKEWLRI